MLRSLHTVSSGARHAIQPRRKERSSAELLYFERFPSGDITLRALAHKLAATCGVAGVRTIEEALGEMQRLYVWGGAGGRARDEFQSNLAESGTPLLVI